MSKKTAVIIGAGPAGLTAAYELLKKTDIKPVIFESTNEIGGIARTFNYKGNRMDMGGHRFFSKSERVMKWWLDILPMQGYPAKDDLLLNREKVYSRNPNAPDPEKTDEVMLIRNRLSRIYYLRKFFDYPVSLNINTVKNLGIMRIIRIGLSYIRICFFPVKNESSLEDFMINRFGKELYMTFFKDYTQKVWGVHPSKIKPDWGTQRIKGLSVTKVLMHAIKNIFNKSDKSISQKKTETSLIEQFLYPKYGPGHLWEEASARIISMGGEIFLNHKVIGIKCDNNCISEVETLDGNTAFKKRAAADYVFSSMPIKELIRAMGDAVDSKIKQTAEGLVYRDFITVGLLLKKLKIQNQTGIKTIGNIVPDIWIYIQERDVNLGRFQVFNNWSPYMVRDLENTVWVGLEYFCNDGDELWNMDDKEFINFAVNELVKIGIIDPVDVIDRCLVRVPKAYPAYLGTYDCFDEIKDYVSSFENLFLVGRNGMHRYNNMDHSMLTAMIAVDNIVNGVKTKENIWAVNTEESHHEER